MRSTQLRHGLAIALCISAVVSLRAGVAAAPPAVAGAAVWKDPVNLPAERMPLAPHALLMGLVDSGPGLIAVGERGTILFAPQYTSNWTQVDDVPTRTTLTAVTAADERRLWAVGHDGVVIASVDGGHHWTLQHKDPWHPQSDGTAEPDPRQGAPLLDVLALDENHVIAVGAYSLMLVTRDGGTTWNIQSIVDHSADGAAAAAAAQKEDWTFSKQELAIGDESDPHFNAITRTDNGSLFIAGERGVAFRSRDHGQTWERVKWPYDGSMFGAIGYEGQHILAFGLRGHAYESEDLGDHWREIDTGTELSLLGGTRLSEGGAALVGSNGLVLLRRSAKEAFRAGSVHSAGALVAVFPEEGEERFIVLGENGAGFYQPKP